MPRGFPRVRARAQLQPLARVGVAGLAVNYARGGGRSFSPAQVSRSRAAAVRATVARRVAIKPGSSAPLSAHPAARGLRTWQARRRGCARAGRCRHGRFAGGRGFGAPAQAATFIIHAAPSRAHQTSSWLILLEALAALAILLLIVWWTMFSTARRASAAATQWSLGGNGKGQRVHAAAARMARSMRLRSARRMPRTQRHAKVSAEAHRQVEHAGERDAAMHHQVTLSRSSETERAQRGGRQPGGQRDVAHLGCRPTSRVHRHQPSISPARRWPPCPRCAPPPGRPAPAARAQPAAPRSMRGSTAMALSRRWKTNQFSAQLAISELANSSTPVNAANTGGPAASSTAAPYSTWFGRPPAARRTACQRLTSTSTRPAIRLPTMPADLRADQVRHLVDEVPIRRVVARRSASRPSRARVIAAVWSPPSSAALDDDEAGGAWFNPPRAPTRRPPARSRRWRTW